MGSGNPAVVAPAADALAPPMPGGASSAAPFRTATSSAAPGGSGGGRALKIPLRARLAEVFINYAPLALTTFGGPQANIAVLLDLFVVRRKWLTEKMFAELFAISNSLPGPGSTQLAFTVALIRGGVAPGVLAFLIWSIPAGIIMASLGYAVSRAGASDLPGIVLHLENGFASVAVALVAGAAYKLGVKLITDRFAAVLAVIGASVVVVFSSSAWAIPLVMAAGGLATFIEAYRPASVLRFAAGLRAAWQRHARGTAAGTEGEGTEVELVEVQNGSAAVESGAVESVLEDASTEHVAQGPSSGGLRQRRQANLPEGPAVAAVQQTEQQQGVEDELEEVYFTYTPATGLAVLGVWLALFVASIVLRTSVDSRPLNVFGTFFFIGSIIFGGGPVVVPLTYGYVVPNGWLTPTEFLLGLAIVNAMPGPNFNFAAYCGALAFRGSAGTSFAGAVLGWLGIFLPGLLIKAGVLPFWRRYRRLAGVRAVFRGFNSVAVGLVFAATFLLWQKALAVGPGDVRLDAGVGAASGLGQFPFYVAVAAVAFVLVEHMRALPPLIVIAGGLVGLAEWGVTLRMLQQ
ncbi:hypothetical protein HK405_004871 [Cladochytrium tenue]|nr:hypothetical protein HK405_004871 [Cladochytrium tenue]